MTEQIRTNRIGSGFSTGNWRLLILVGLAALMVPGGCATQKQADLLQRQIWAVEQQLSMTRSQLTGLEKGMNEKLQELSGRFEADSQPLRRNQAAVGAQLDRIEVELGRLNGRLEELAVAGGGQGEKIGRLEKRQAASETELQANIAALQDRLNRLALYLGLRELVFEPTGAGARPGEKAKAGAAPSAQAQAAVRRAPVAAEKLYAEALRLFQSGQFAAAKERFRRYLKAYPHTDLTDNAQFWLGECYYAEKNYRQAIAAYDRIIKNYPGGDKVSSALLKQAMAFLELGDKTAARILLKKVVKGYPGSTQARIAQIKLARIK